MKNKAMERKLKSGDAIDVSGFEQTADGDYIVKHFEDGFDYCNAKTEEWIWSIGKSKGPGYVDMPDGTKRMFQKGFMIASESSKFHMLHDDDSWECIWLR